MKHRLPRAQGQSIKPLLVDQMFVPYQDFLGLGHSQGFSSIAVPGAGEANFDGFEANPYETKSQRRQGEVVKLLEKLQPDSITLDPADIGTIDQASKEVKAKESREEMESSIAYQRQLEKKRKKKMRGRSKAGHKDEIKVR